MGEDSIPLHDTYSDRNIPKHDLRNDGEEEEVVREIRDDRGGENAIAMMILYSSLSKVVLRPMGMIGW